MKGLVVDDALKAGTQIGPVVDQNQLEQDLNYIGIGQDEGAKLASGGELLNRETPGFYPAAGAVHRVRPTRCASPARRSSGRWRP